MPRPSPPQHMRRQTCLPQHMRSVLIKRAPWAVRDVSLGYLWNAQCGVLSKPRKMCGVLSLFMSLSFRNVTDGITMWGPSHRIPQSPWLVTCLTVYICSFLSLLFLKTSNHWLLSLKHLIFLMLTFLLIQKQIPAILISRWNVHLRPTVSSPLSCVCVCVLKVTMVLFLSKAERERLLRL